MPINLRAPEVTELKPRITVLGVGGAGGNAVNNMINSKLEGVNFIVANTDAQALAQSKADAKIQLGARVTEGLGAGAKPDVGRAAAEESLEEILERTGDSHMVFVTAGMGGGTGTGAAPVIARAVRELGILTVGVVTKPFHFEGERRMKLAERGIEELQNFVDTLIVIPNQNLFRVANERTTFAQAFAMADDVLHSGVRGITDLIVMPGLINRDFADIKTVMSEMGKAMMGTGEMDGENRALRAAEAAISNPLLDEVSMKGARAVLVNVTGGPDLMLFEVDEAVNRIRAEVDSDSNILFGSALSETMEGRVRVSVVATGIDAEDAVRHGADNVEQLWPRQARTETIRVVAEHKRAAAIDENPVHLQVESITQGFMEDAASLESAIENLREPGSIGGEPLTLGGDDAPMIADSPADTGSRSLAEFTAKQEPKREKRRFAGLFGRSKREPQSEAKREPVVQAREPSRSASTQTAIVQPKPVQPPAPKISVTKQAPSAVAAKLTASPVRDERPEHDLFGEARDDKRAAIPAFLRAQDNPVEGAEDDRFEIPAFLRRQAGSGN